jgi:N-acetylmuramoyl-L-alanine amidase
MTSLDPLLRRLLVVLTSSSCLFIVSTFANEIAPSREPVTSPDTARCDANQFRVAIDVGHTPQAPGATSARGVTEYTFNLRLARYIQKSLVAGGFMLTNLINLGGSGRGQLIERSERANALGVNLFLSVHHDSVQANYLSPWDYEGRHRAFSDRFSGYSLFVSLRNDAAVASLAFAQLFARELSARKMQFTMHHAENIPGERRSLLDRNLGIYRYDNLAVLMNTRAPAVLFEAGVIVNRRDELLLSSPEYQGRISDAALSAVNEFCAVQSAGGR